MSKHFRKKTYHSPESLYIMPDQLGFFENPTVETNPALEATRLKACAEFRLIAKYHRAEFHRIIDVLKRLKGEVPEANSSDSLPRERQPKRLWRLRSDSNMDVIASMLEAAGLKGVSEKQMVNHLRSIGRLTSATAPERSVHWTVSELRIRTLNAVRKDGPDGARWYAYGNFNEWRGPAA